MIKFDNDYSKSAHPVILDVLTQDAKNSHTGYGLDTWCKRATAEIRRATGSPTADVHYLVGGTQTNMTISSPFQGWQNNCRSGQRGRSAKRK